MNKNYDPYYSKKVLDHFKRPRNMGVMKNPDGIGKVGNPVCGDVMKLYIRVSKKGNRKVISDIKFETFGCVAAIASSSMLTEIVKGKSFKEVLKITKKDVANRLGGLPPVKIHCSLLAVDALIEAIYDYLSKNKLNIPKELEKRHKNIRKE